MSWDHFYQDLHIYIFSLYLDLQGSDLVVVYLISVRGIPSSVLLYQLFLTEHLAISWQVLWFFQFLIYLVTFPEAYAT